MTATYLIPLNPETSDQRLSVELSGNPYILRVLWNDRFGYWSLSINTADDEPILSNVKMVKDFGLTSRFKSTLLPPGELFFIQENGTSSRPSYEDMGTTHNLYYYEPDPVAPVEIVTVATTSVPLGTIWDSGASVWDGGDSEWDQ
jgi:hypothetical protein